MYSEIKLSKRTYNEIVNDVNPRLLRADDITELNNFTKHAVFRLRQADEVVTQAVEAACCTENACPAEEHHEMVSRALRFFDGIEAEVVERDRLNRRLVISFNVVLVLAAIAIIGSTGRFSTLTGFEFPVGRSNALILGVILGGLSVFLWQINPLSVRSKADRQLLQPVSQIDYACILRGLQSLGDHTPEEMTKFPIMATHLLYGRQGQQLTVLKFLAIMAAIARTRVMLSNATYSTAAKQLDEYFQARTHR